MAEVFHNEAYYRRADGRGKVVLPASLSIAFYNNIRLFDLMMAAVLRQSTHDFELIISDDGSKPEVVQHIQKKLSQLQIPATHIWHEDKGFRKNRMLNWMIHHSSSDYLIFVDQDCLPHREFVAEHVKHKVVGGVLCGRRMELTPWLSKLLTPLRVGTGYIEKNLWWIIPAGAYMKDNNGMKGIYVPEGPLREHFNKKYRPLVGCNFSIHKKDLIEINGFDWRYEAAGTGEDSDIDFRLSLNGVKMIPFVNSAVQYHVFHKLTPKSSVNEGIFSEVLRSTESKTKYGFKEQLKEAGVAEMEFQL